MNIGKFSVSNPVLINILMVSILLLGVFSYIRLPQQVMSNIDFSWVLVAYAYPGASAEEIEKSVIMKVEKEIKDLDHLKKITSTIRDGSGFMFVEFDDDISGSEFSRLAQDLRAELDKVELPEDVPDPWINEFSSTDMMTILSVNLINSSASTRELQRRADILKDRLLDIPNVSDVQIYGGREKEIWLEVDRERMEAFGVGLDEVVNAVKYRNMNIPGGRLEMGKVSYLLESRGAVDKPEDFGRIVVRSTPGGGSITVGDMASINDGFAEAEYNARFNGTPCVSLLLTRTAAGNEIRIVEAAKKVVEEFRETLPAGITIELSNDNTFFIRDTLGTLGRNALMGFCLVVIVLVFFLGLRNSLITALGIPITFAITFIFMEWYGESLNGNSLFALVLVLGMIVDHAIVIIENSYRHRQKGLSAAEAAIRGTNEVVWPVTAATLTTLAAFLPLMLLPGIMGKFMRIVPIVVSLALFASTLEALVFLPVHFVEWGGRVKEEGTGLIGRFRTRFKALVGRIYRHRWLALGITAAVIIVTAALTRFVHEDLFAEEDWTLFFINIELPIGTPRSTTDEVTRRFEQRILPYLGKGEIVSLTTTVGLVQTDDDWVERSSVAQISIDVAERKQGRTRPMAEIMDEIRNLCSDIPGAESVRYAKVNTGPPMDKPVQFRLSGDNYQDMASIAADFKQMLEQYPELYNIDDNFDPGAPQLRIRLKEDRARELGLTAAQLGMYVRNCFEGAEATTYFDAGEEVDVVVKLSKRDRESMDALMQMKFPTPDGRMIPFSTVCTVERGTSMSIIKHTDGKREVTVSADAEHTRNTKAISGAIQKAFDEKYARAYPDISLKMGGAWAEFGVVFLDILRLFWIGLFLIYVILGAQFKSFLQPVIIMFTIPFAFVGCVIFLVISGTPVSITVLFAGVALAGIAVNDSIVLISFVNDLRRTGVDIAEAVAEGAAVRLRPIVLTSVTTIGGLLPMALGLGGKSMTWGPMASTISFGLLFSTVGTLIVMPCAYGALHDTIAWTRNVLGLDRRSP